MSIVSSLARSARLSRIVPAAVLVLGVASLASAQTVTLRGEVEDEGPQFVLSCTPVTLVSAGPNLNAVLGEDVEIVGSIVGTNLVSVQTVTLVSDVLELNNDPKLGEELKIEVSGPAGQVVQVYAALDAGFAVVKHMGLFLDPAGLAFLLQGTIPAVGQLQVELHIPNDPIFAGLDVFCQVVRLQAGGGFTLGNSDCATIQP